MLGADEFDDGILVAVLEPRWIEVGRLRLDDVSGEIAHLGRELQVRNVVEVSVLAPHLVGVAQQSCEDALAERFEEHHALAAGDHHPGDTRPALLPHGVPDDREGLLGDLVVRRDVVRRFEVAHIDLLARNEALDVDRMGALDADGFEFLVLDDDVGALPDLVSLDLLVVLDRLAGLRIDELAFDAVSGLPVEGMEADPGR